MDSTALITGATGFLGREVAHALLAGSRTTRLVALMRAPDALALVRRRWSLVAGLPSEEADRVTVIRGDVTAPHLGLDSRSWAALLERIDRVVHVAATTRFDHPLDEARRQNVEGTSQVLDFCRQLRAAGQTGRLDYVSTAYVAGSRRDLVGEDELDAGQSFRNSYEQSKYEAERLCRRARADLPVAIYRPSIIVGSARTGETTSFKALYWPLEVLVRFYRCAPAVLPRLVPLPLHPECSLDVVPVDWVAHAVASLYHRPEAIGRCYHLAAGPDGAATTAALVALCGQHFGVEPPRFAAPGGPVFGFAHRARPFLRLGARRFLRQVEAYYPYSVQNPSFDVRNARAAGLAPPAVATYFSCLLAFAEATDFGRRPAAAAEATPPVPREGSSSREHLRVGGRGAWPT